MVWHEYTHGLSNRLVTNADGSGALNTPQAGAMGEAWSDWYASDLQVRDELKDDDLGAPGEIDVGDYTDLDAHALRTQALDCPVGAVTAACPGGAATGVGGYTLGDFGKVFGAPEVHADGEIWAETLWDLRQALQVKTGSAAAASDVAETLVSNGMRMSPPEPSMLDMRNAILSAEQVEFGGAFHDLVWDVFRKRGMGYFASSNDGADTTPIEDFQAPPDPNGPKGAVTGVVTNSDSGLPVAGVRVGFGGHASQPEFDEYLADDTDANGRYMIEGVPVGTYPKLAFFPSAGFDPETARNVEITQDQTTTRDAAMTRDWSALSGGAEIASVSDDTSAPFGCGVDQAFDQSQGTGWSAFNPTSEDPGNPEAGPPTVVVELPADDRRQRVPDRPVGDLRRRGIGHDARVHGRDLDERDDVPDGGRRPPTAAQFTDANIGRLNRREPAGDSGKATKFVRLTMLHPLREGAPASRARTSST